MVENILKTVRTSRNGRRLLTSEQKAYIVDSWESSGRSAPEFCRQYGLIATQLYKWRTDAKRGAVMGIRHEGELHSRTELEALRKENEELKKALGEASLDIRILKKKLEMDELRNQKSKTIPGSFRSARTG